MRGSPPCNSFRIDIRLYAVDSKVPVQYGEVSGLSAS